MVGCSVSPPSTDPEPAQAKHGVQKLQRMQEAVKVLLLGLGEDVDREGLRETPKVASGVLGVIQNRHAANLSIAAFCFQRVAKALLDASAGYRQTAASVLGNALFHEREVAEGNGGLVIVRDIDFASTSEETLLPFHGRCHVAYIPQDGVVLGLSKLARLTKHFSKRLQTQEQLGLDIARALNQHLSCSGIAVMLLAKHLSPTTPPSQVITACVGGCFAEAGSLQLQELLMILGLEDLPASAVQQLPTALEPELKLSAAAAHITLPHADVCSLQALEQVAAPPTPDASEKDMDGETSSEDVTMDSDASCELMESAVQQLLVEMGEDPMRPGLRSSARQYINSLLASTWGYHQKLPSRWVGSLGASTSANISSTSTSFTRHCTCCPAPFRLSSSSPEALDNAALLAASPDPCHRELLSSSLQPLASRPTSSIASTATYAPARGVAALNSIDTFHAHATSSSSHSTTGMATTAAPNSSMVRHARFLFNSQCEHHMLPFYGSIHVAYIPGPGTPSLQLEQLDYIIRMYTLRLQVQERITQQVADAVHQVAQAAGVMVVVNAKHMCMVARGVENHAGCTTSLATRGLFDSQPELRMLVLGRCRASNSC